MHLAPLLIAFSLATGAVQSETNWEEILLPARAALGEELPDIAVSRLEAIIESPAFQASPPTAKTSVYQLLGEAMVRNGQWERAVTTLTPLSDDSPTRNYWLGLAQAKLGDTATALLTLSKVPAEEPALGSLAQYNRLEILTRLGDTEKALALLEALRVANPDFRPQDLALTEAALDLRKNEPGLAKKALTRIELKDARALALAGRIELLAQEMGAALAFFDQSLAADPTLSVRVIALLGKADIHLAKEEPFLALDQLLTILEIASSAETHELLIPRFAQLIELTNNSDLRQRLQRELLTFTATLAEEGEASEARWFIKYQQARLLPRKESLRELQALLETFPEAAKGSALASRIHLLLARAYLETEQPQAAKEELQKLLTHAESGPLSAIASDLLAREAANDGRWPEAAKRFQEAAQTSNAEFADIALLNKAVIALRSPGASDLSAISAQLSSPASRTSLALETLLAASLAGEPAVGDDLRQFLTENPNHPRRADASLALTTLLLKANHPDATAIRESLETGMPALTKEQSKKRFALSHQMGVYTDDWDLAVRFGERHLKRHPNSQTDPYLLLRLGESRFRNGDFDRARLIFSDVAQLEDAGDLKDIALYYGARSNLAIPSASATTEALATLDELIARSGPLATQARILKARTLLENLGKPSESLEVLENLPGELTDQPEVALLAAEAYRELGSSDPSQYDAALKTYRSLLADDDTSYARSNQLHYLIARTYRESGRPGLALEPCLRVIDFENLSSPETPPEWDFYYRCGFEAIDLLLEAKRYRAALLQARKLAKTKGPGAAQAKERAEQIQLDHTLFTD